MQYISYLILAIAYFSLAKGKIPGLASNRATIVALASALLMANGTLNLEEAWATFDGKIIFFFLSMIVVNVYLAYSGFFQLILSFFIRLTNNPFGLMVVLTFCTGLLSAFFFNYIIAFFFTPLILNLTEILRLNPTPYLLGMIAATNIGSLATITGNFQNIIISSFFEISYLQFSYFLVPLVVICLLLQIIISWIFFTEVRSFKTFQNLPKIQVGIFKGLLAKTLVIIIVLLISFIFNAPLPEASLTAAAFLLITRKVKPEEAFKIVDWNIVLMFFGFFLLTQAIENLDLFPQFLSFQNISLQFLLTVTMLSNFISNIPTVLLIQPWLESDNTQVELFLAAGATLAGNLTLFGSITNLITVETAEKLGCKVTFFDHLRFGLPLTIITLIVAYFWLTFGYDAISEQ